MKELAAFMVTLGADASTNLFRMLLAAIRHRMMGSKVVAQPIGVSPTLRISVDSRARQSEIHCLTRSFVGRMLRPATSVEVASLAQSVSPENLADWAFPLSK